MTYKYPLATATWDKEEIDAMYRVIESGKFTMGEQVKTFEDRFASQMRGKHCVMVNSGSSANLLMVAALFYTSDPLRKLKRGDEVIVPAVSWSTTYYPLYQYGLHLKFVDIDIETLNFDIDSLEAAITDRTKLIFAVNLLGNPNNFDRINQIIGDRPITLIEDNCESMGATFGSKFAGTFGLMGSFSSFFSHHISTMEGGLILTDDEEMYHILLSLRAHGWTRNLPSPNFVCGEKSENPFEEQFRFVLPGYNVRPLELEGALGIEQLKKLTNLIHERRVNGAKWQRLMSGHPDFVIQKEIGKSSWFGFSIVIREGSRLSRPELIDRLKNLGFETRPIVAGNFAKNSVVQYFDHEIFDELRNADRVDEFGLFIGNHHYPMDEAFEALSNL